MEKFRFANEREAAAAQLLERNAVTLTPPTLSDGMLSLLGTVKDGDRMYAPDLAIDADERLARASCTCNFYQQNKLTKGPCEHILALRMWHGRMTKTIPL